MDKIIGYVMVGTIIGCILLSIIVFTYHFLKKTENDD